MNITILAGHSFNRAAAGLIQRLVSDGGPRFSVVICHSFKDLWRSLVKKVRDRGIGSYYRDHTGVSLPGMAKKMGFNIYFSSGINSRLTERLLMRIKPDVAVPFGIGIIRKRILAIPKLGIVNAHMGLLPKYRGMNVLEWSLLNGDLPVLSTHWMDQGIDTGDILLTRELRTEQADTIESLRSRAEISAIDLLYETLHKISAGLSHGRRQAVHDGKQYFLMHPRLKEYVNMKMSRTGNGTHGHRI